MFPQALSTGCGRNFRGFFWGFSGGWAVFEGVEAPAGVAATVAQAEPFLADAGVRGCPVIIAASAGGTGGPAIIATSAGGAGGPVIIATSAGGAGGPVIIATSAGGKERFRLAPE